MCNMKGWKAHENKSQTPSIIDIKSYLILSLSLSLSLSLYFISLIWGKWQRMVGPHQSPNPLLFSLINQFMLLSFVWGLWIFPFDSLFNRFQVRLMSFSPLLLMQPRELARSVIFPYSWSYGFNLLFSCFYFL